MLVATSAIALASCGGGGGGGGGSNSAPNNPTSPTTPPTAPPSPPAPPGPAATVLLSGVARFESVPSSATNGALLYNGTTAKPIRGASVEILSVPQGLLLATTETDANGAYSVLIPPTDAVRVRVRAQLVRSGTPGWDFRVRDNTRGEAQYVLDSAPLSGLTAAVVPPVVAGSGWDGSSSYVAPRAGGVFAILDAVYEAHQKILAVAPGQVLPPLNLFWSVNNRPACCNNGTGLIGTSNFSAGGSATAAIYLLGQANADTDEYDSHVVVHEFGHYLQWAASRNDSVGGPHGANDRLDMRVAFSEGWGNAWSGVALNDPVYRDSLGTAQASGFILDVSVPLPPAQQPGWYKEESIQFVIWEANRLLGGFEPLWLALTGPVKTTDAATSAHLLAFALKQVAPGQASTVTSIFSSQNIATNDAFGAGETNSGGIAEALPVYRQHAGIGTTLSSLCVTGAAGVPNKLGNYLFVRVTIPSSGPRTITLTGGIDPDFEIFNATFSARAEGVVSGQEQLSVDLAAGSYVIAVTEFQLSPGQQRCLSLTIN